MSPIAIDAFNDWTFWIWFGVWPVWLILEALILYLRGQRVNVHTISMVARDSGWRLNSLVYLWAMCGTHWWWNAAQWARVWTAVLTWVILGLLLAFDFAWSRAVTPVDKEFGQLRLPWLKSPKLVLLRPWYRSPKLWLVVGALAGAILFPQRVA